MGCRILLAGGALPVTTVYLSRFRDDSRVGANRGGRMAEIPLGRFCWYELLTTDPEAAATFYGQVTGWTTTTWENEGASPYTMWMNGEQPIGGLMQMPEGAAQALPHWLAHVSTPDLDGTKAKAQELGGRVLNEISVATVGDFAIVQDPQGAIFSAFQPEGDAPGHDGAPGLGEFSWNELATDDWKAAWDFYTSLFGWQRGDAMDMGEMGTYQMYTRGAHPLGGIFNRPPEIPVSSWLFYVRVPSADEAGNKVGELGGKVLNGPMDVPGGDRIAQCTDPQGAVFAVHSTSQP
jgi:predicted enzyme related to lactoylglutathione lyase